MSFKAEISVLKQEINKYLFCVYDDIVEKVLKSVNKPFLEKQLTYYDVIVILLKENEKTVKFKDQIIQQKDEKIKEKENEVDRLNQKLEDLTEKYKNSDLEFRARHSKETNAFLKKVWGIVL